MPPWAPANGMGAAKPAPEPSSPVLMAAGADGDGASEMDEETRKLTAGRADKLAICHQEHAVLQIPKKRSRRLVSKLAAYATASTSFVATESNAAIMYTEFPPNGMLLSDGFDLDLNNDNVTDLTVHHYATRYDIGWRSSVAIFSATAVPPANNAVAKNVNGAARFAAGETISPRDIYALGQEVLLGAESCAFYSSYTTSRATNCWRSSGAFGSGRGFLGLSFSIPATGGAHTAWLDIGVGSQLRLYAFAFETEPGAPITAGDVGVIGDNFGDTNGDGKVDIVDLNNVRNNFGATGNGVLGDTNNDDLVNIEDLNAVRNNFGAGNPVPEPPSLVLLAAGAAGLAVLRRKRAASE